MRRPVWLAAGMALGVGGTLWAEQRVRRAARRAAGRLAPEQVVAGARQSVRQVGDRVRSAVDAGREARATREAELWDEFGARAGPPAVVAGTRPRPRRAGRPRPHGGHRRGRVGAGEAGRLVRMDADKLRGVFTGFFAARGHARVPSASLIPQHPRAPLFTNAGMNQFIPYFLGEELPPYRRATTVQKCVRVRGKHDDIDLVGRTTRHLTFFEMLGNFSFGDYFKVETIPWAWELLTGDLGLDGDRLWATVYTDDDEADGIWRDAVGLPAERIQRMGEDNFWEMGETGPCGPCSEIYYDRGPAFGEAGGPVGGGEERYVELWNLVFTQYDRQPDGSLEPLPRPNIDTGAGFERVLTILEGVPSIWETGVLRPIIARAEQLDRPRLRERQPRPTWPCGCWPTTPAARPC